MSSISDRLKAYESSVGKRTGRLAITIDQGTVSSLGCTAKVMKWYLRGLCVFLVISAIIILAMGSYMSNNNGAAAALGSGFTNAIYCMGAFLLIMGVFGLIGAVRESRLFVWIFSALMVIMTIILIILSAVLLSYAGQEQSVLDRFWQVMSTDERVYIQSSYNCCGGNLNPLENYEVGGTNYPIYLQWDQCANTPPHGCAVGSPLLANPYMPPGTTTPQPIPYSPNMFDADGQLHAYPCPPWENSATPQTAASLNPVPGCVPALVNNYKAAVTGFGVAGIFMAVFCFSGIASSCCLLSGIQASEEQQKSVNKKGSGRV